MKKSTIIKIDLLGFHRRSISQSDQDNVDFLSNYYECIIKSIQGYGWRIVKTIGDSVLIEAESNLDFLSKFYLDIKSNYHISMTYRVCQYEILNVQVGLYSCSDLIGTDINLLFLNDSKTHRLK